MELMNSKKTGKIRRIQLMKNKPLKHYKRKKFFYRFFIRKSPRAGAMFGLAWFVCIHLFNTVVMWFLTHTETYSYSVRLPEFQQN